MEDDKPRFGEFASKYQGSDGLPSESQGQKDSLGLGGSSGAKSEIERQLEDFQMQMAPKIQGYQQDIMTRFADFEKGCYLKSKSSSDKFTECMIGVQKKLKGGQQKLQFGLSFSQYKLLDCFQRQDRSGKNFSYCKKEAEANLEKIFQAFLDQMD